MSDQGDDYDDFDDYLEDPSKLDSETSQGADEIGDNSNNNGKSSNKTVNENPEMAGIINELQSDFQALLKTDNGSNEQDSEKFNNLLGTLGAAASSPQIPEPKGPSASSGKYPPHGKFRDIVSNTLDRLKEGSAKIDSKIQEEKQSQNPDAILSQLLEQLGDGSVGDESSMDSTIATILNQMSSKEVMYQPMKEMQHEFTAWMAENGDREEHKENLKNYQQQLSTVNKIVSIYERDDYTNEKYRTEITDLIDTLEQLGDSPINKGFNSTEVNKELDNLAKLMEVEGDENMAHLDKELEDTCKQQ
ncbi:HCL228Wp [Eremothecium sinecaudum]|uniref:HCL228Wp n=1 Tax=Eremothecium sinecaudum TaxID=45286 RepID=A0A120K1Z2_9SACH|nr:HCL228Wp [Eremothecium sinecaudum]AMD19923.1 HCL228Wp [Eremothecium sinecaudum]